MAHLNMRKSSFLVVLKRTFGYFFQAKSSKEAEAAAVERLKHVENELRMKNTAYEKQEQEVNAMTSIIVDHINMVWLFSPADSNTSIRCMNT